MLPLSDIWEMRPGGATRYRYLHNTLTLQVRTLSKPFFFIDFHWFSMIFIDITVYMHICETTHYRSRWSGGMTSSDAAECFAEAPGHPGARPDRIWRPAQARTPSNQISQIWKFQDFLDLVLHTMYVHRYDQKSRTMCYLCLTFGKCAQGARQGTGTYTTL